ncbi:hypothetical protein ACFFLS_10445 [Flavobacterium procerum]|uniref:Uncharacterized protein n=1 Tax=Flavobacterium procerum TaxID=1455569 RepID=A0ABV6BPW8_9FLAO
MGKTTTKQDFTVREEKIITKIIEILATEKYFDPESKLYTINEKTLKEFFPKTASLKTIADVTSKSPLFNYEAGNIAWNSIVTATVEYTIEGASKIKIDGMEGDINGGTMRNVYLEVPGYSFVIDVETSNPHTRWVFKATKIQISPTKTRKMSPSSVSGQGGRPNVIINTVEA